MNVSNQIMYNFEILNDASIWEVLFYFVLVIWKFVKSAIGNKIMQLHPLGLFNIYLRCRSFLA